MKNNSNINKKWRNRNPEKVKAHIAINNAVRYGKLKKLPCQECGDIKSQAHHSDYSKPLDILWVCQKCHKKIHHPIELRASKRKKVITIKESIKAKAKELKEAGLTYQKIADTLKTSKATVYKAVNNTDYS
jgi:transposase-like protein